MKATLWKSNLNTHLKNIGDLSFEYKNTDTPEGQKHVGDVEYALINLHPSVEYQTIGGMGGAFSESSASLWAQSSPATQNEVIKAYFDRENGIGYNFGRLSIGSCDFSIDDYSYVQENDYTLETFDVSHDKECIFPMVKEAMKYSQIKLMASPWSPPKYMKDNASLIGGKLKKDCYSLWAKYVKKYVEACRVEGLNLWGLTLQNEPRHHQMWESCQYTPAEEAEYLGVLGKELEGENVKLFCYDHCRERVFERAEYVFNHPNANYCDGIAHHWYSGTHFGELKALYKAYPNKLSIASEGCCAVGNGQNYKDLELGFAERYAEDICGCFANGVNYYCDWNLVLDENNGPSHNREGRDCTADSPMHIVNDKVEYKLSYYYIGHFSKFIMPEAKVIASSSYDSSIDAVAFKNPDGKMVAVLLNRTDDDKTCILRIGDNIADVDLGAHSIITAVIEK